MHTFLDFNPEVDDHKTSKAYDQAILSLNPDEFEWLDKLNQCNCCQMNKGEFVFHTMKGRQFQKPQTKVQMAWKDVGRIGPISFNLIQSSVASQVRKLI